jgi:hypothetical protein
MSEQLKVTPEGMPTIEVAGVAYPLCFTVYSLQRWAEYKDTDYQGVLEAGWPIAMPAEDLSKLLEVALAGGDARRQAFEPGASPREIAPALIDRLFVLYTHLELVKPLSEAWNMVPSGEKTDRPPLPDSPGDDS